MSGAVWYAGGALCGYLFGCINTAGIISRAKGFDIRRKGSGNAGASNMYVSVGKGAAAVTALTDILKAFLPVFLLMHVLNPPVRHVHVLTGCMIIIGHMFPFWMQFRGGKGFASLLGLALALDWRFLLICLGFVALYLATLHYIALASITCAVLMPVWHGFVTHSVPETVMLAVTGIVMLIKHRENIVGMITGTEIEFQRFRKKKDPEGRK